MTVDGSTYTVSSLLNGRIPGPDLVVTEGQIVIVKVTNKLTSEGITIHWHGIKENLPGWMVLPLFYSLLLSPVQSLHTYLHEATLAGTHWYHSHAGPQRTDSLFWSTYCTGECRYKRACFSPIRLAAP